MIKGEDTGIRKILEGGSKEFFYLYRSNSAFCVSLNNNKLVNNMTGKSSLLRTQEGKSFIMSAPSISLILHRSCDSKLRSREVYAEKLSDFPINLKCGILK